jgi:GntR family transcriptional regulator
VSQGTVRKAIDDLATENLLVRRQGSSSPHAEQIQYRFLRLCPTRPIMAWRANLDAGARAPAESRVHWAAAGDRR